MVPETSVSTCNQLTRLCAREDFIEFSRRESFKLHNFSSSYVFRRHTLFSLLSTDHITATSVTMNIILRTTEGRKVLVRDTKAIQRRCDNFIDLI
jgi:hypothetical protein